ncbi:hypothetical protein LSH36_883g00003 [Paralvinella palmiformis]|uniref:Uncharacterized protein n=1 Tax=Paralvinella palmiformis TaxID=53620 RepID=A0AAD9IYQ9_9ANNE|nr:hypothetical protein LSH36_883g00003 [Paralvinella palmiformis]
MFYFLDLDCRDCLLLEDPTRDIWQDCIRFMSDSEKIEMRHNCLEDFEHFNKDLSDGCYVKRGKNVTLPECAVKKREMMDHHDSTSSKCKVIKGLSLFKENYK